MCLKEIFAKKSLKDVIDHVIDNEISDLMRGSHTAQVQFVESHLGVKVIGHYERWAEFVEIFERRNLVAHGNLVVNRTYIENCRDAKCKDIERLGVGASLSLDQKYLLRSVEILSEFGILLVFVLWRKHMAESDEEAFRKVNDICYNFIKAGRTRLASRLLDFCLYKQKRGCSDSVSRMMIVNLANSYKKRKDDARCQKTLTSIDWTATNDRFQICKASLQGDVDAVLALMPNKAISAAEFREWPVLDWVRDDPKVNEAFEKIYGEPMRSGIPEAVTNTQQEVGEEAKVEIAEASAARNNVTSH
jgi:hypothetical protein